MKFNLSSILLFLVIIIASVIGLRMFQIYFLTVKSETAGVVGELKMEITQQSEQRRTQSYNHFFDACSAIQGYEASIRAQEVVRDTYKDDKAIDRANTIIASVSAQRDRAIAQYNVDVRKELTLGRFKDSSLPEQLDINKPTICD